MPRDACRMAAEDKNRERKLIFRLSLQGENLLSFIGYETIYYHWNLSAILPGLRFCAKGQTTA